MCRELKDSGIPWIGEIPKDWGIDTIGNLYTLRTEKVSDKDYAPLSVTKMGIVPQLETAAKTDDGDNRKLVRVGDFAINSRSDRRGSCGISAYDGSVSLINLVLTPRGQMSPRFYNWLFHTELFADEFYKWGHGIVDDLWTTRWQEMKRISIVSPSYQEQQRIAEFLDRKCAEVDEMIALQEQIIEELKAYKQSVITEAVTKGLNPAAPMRDSEIVFVDKIPSHWKETKTLRLLSMPITDGPHETPDGLDDGIPFISADAVSDGYINFDNKWGYISQKYYEECCKKYIPQKYDIYMIKSGASTGRTAIVETDEIFTIWSPLAVFRANTNIILPYFLLYVLRSDYYQKQVENKWSFGTQQNIGMRVLEKLLISYPPITEQQAIADYLDEKCADIDSLIQTKQSKIDSLKEYKKSIIYEYVTGKREVE